MAMERLEAHHPGAEVSGGPRGYRPPSPDIRVHFRRLMDESPLFSLDVSRDVEADFVAVARAAAASVPLGGRRGRVCTMVADGTLRPAGLPRFLEDEYFRLFESEDVSDLNYLLYLLLRCGKAPLPIAEYAAEVGRALTRRMGPPG